ncbi:Transcriptional regulator [Pseudomonas meliae]|nr:Transcriptional regulator [Pseudomonas meliae]
MERQTSNHPTARGALMFLSLEVRSYKTQSPQHCHDHTQLVLPIRGRMEIDVDGRGGFIDQSLAALVK